MVALTSYEHEEPNLWQQFRLHYGEGGGKEMEKLYRAYCMGYQDMEARFAEISRNALKLLKQAMSNKEKGKIQ